MTVVLRASKPERHRPADSFDVRRERARYLYWIDKVKKMESKIAAPSTFNLGHRYLSDEHTPDDDFNINTFVSVL